ncbi:MAG TPA: phosphoribosyltransferase family protein [Verrucomicrobiae bacterium]|nr:phosphoribosyltransferase family protein [Verrucomicrobiae bacterium]
MSVIRKNTLYSLGVKTNGDLRSRGNKPFNPARYSRFKYGDSRVSLEFAREIATLLVADPTVKRRLLSGKAVITSSAYKVVPTAAHSVAAALYTLLLRQGYPVQHAFIYRSNLSEGDYAKKSLEERQQLMANNGLILKEEDFADHHVIVIDDIRITGSHERAVESLFSTIAVKSLHFLYAVEMKPVDALADPTIEDRINHYWMKSPKQLLSLMKRPAFVLNARTCKYILALPAPELTVLLAGLDDSRLAELHAGIKGDEYHKMDCYRASYRVLLKEVSERKMSTYAPAAVLAAA